MTNRRPPGAPGFEDYRYPGPGPRGPAPGRPPRRPARPATSPVLLGLVYGGIGLLALAVGAVTFFVMALPTDLVRREIIAQVKSETGRDLTIGEATFSFFPTIGVSADKVALSAPPGMGGAPLLTAKSIDVGVRLLPLLRQEIVVDRLVLHEPAFALRVDAQGRKSWDMAALLPPPRVRLAQADLDATVRDFSAGPGLAQSPQNRAEGRSGPSELSLGDIRIDNGTISYADARTGSDVRIAAINAEAGLEAITRPFTAKGSFVWEQEQLDFDGMLTSPSELLSARPAKLALSLNGAPFKLSYDGSVTLTDTLGAEGAVEGSAASLRALAAWLGTDLPPARGFREASLKAYLNATESTVRLADAHIGLDGASATGTLSVTTTGPKPYVTADLKVANLDLGNYMGGEGGRKSPRPARAAAPPPPAAPAQTPQSIEELLQDRSAPQSGPQVRGFTQRAGQPSDWSGEPIDLAPLGNG